MKIQQEKKNIKKAVQDKAKDHQNEPCMKENLKMGELEAAIRKLKPKKAPGPDGVSNDMLKHLGPVAKIPCQKFSTVAGTQERHHGSGKKLKSYQSFRKERIEPAQPTTVPSACSVVL